MSDLPPALERLSSALLDLDDEAMLLEELDGFIAGLLVCPKMIPPSVWLPRVWNREGGGEPVFENIAHANKVMGLVMEHYNDVAVTLFERRGGYAPLFAVDERNGDVIWELWIEGFDLAVKLQPESWRPLTIADVRTAKAWSGLTTLADIARAESRLPQEQIDALTVSAPKKIVGWVLDLNDWRLAQGPPALDLHAEAGPFAASSRKVGRNAPCPCGSGKKYKKCCGLN